MASLFQVMLKKLTDVMAGRGRKQTNRKAHVRTLEELYRISDEVREGKHTVA